MKKFFFDCGTRDATASLGLFILRVLVGAMILIGHGIPKIRGYTLLKENFAVPNFFPLRLLTPAMSLMATIGVDVIAAGLLIIGMATRPAAFLLAFLMVVMAFSYFGAAPWFQSSSTLVETKEIPVLYLIPLLAIIFSGAGNYSLDATICKDSKRRRW